MKTHLVTMFATVLLTLLAPPSLDAELLRGVVVTTPTVEQAASRSFTVEIGMEDLAPINLDVDPRFIEGVRFEVQIPRAARATPGSLGLYLYKSVSPSPEPGLMTMRGERIFFLPIPGAARFFVTVPTNETHVFRPTADTYVTAVSAVDTFPLVIALVPITKGITREIAAARFSIQIEPLIANRGAVRVVVQTPDGTIVDPTAGMIQEFTLQLNGDTLEYTDDELLMSPGLHRVTLESEKYEHQQLTFGIERGRVETLVLRLHEPQSLIRFDAPRGAEIFVNGETVAYEEREVILPPGEHILLFRVGEYTISRRLTVEPRKNYDISLGLSVLIQEN